MLQNLRHISLKKTDYKSANTEWLFCRANALKQSLFTFHSSKHICLLALHGSTDIVVDISALGVKYSIIYWS